MSETSDLEAKLGSQQTDYLKKLEAGGQLPTVISDAWNKAGGAETTALRGQEAKLLTDYVSAGAAAREKYKDVWDPFARDTLASKQTALSYAPIADVRKELAMRAEALGVATNSAINMNNVDTKKAETNLGFTQSAYDRALERERTAQAEADKVQQHQWDVEAAAASRKSSGSSSAASAESKMIASFQKDLSGGLGSKIAIHGEENSTDSNGNSAGYITREDLIRRLTQQYPDIDENDIKTSVYQYYAG